MNAHIPKPKIGMRGEDALLECKYAVDVAVRDLVNKIISAGWQTELAYEALESVVHHQATAHLHRADPADDPAEGRKLLSFRLAPF